MSDEIEILKTRPQETLTEIDQLRQENTELKRALNCPASPPAVTPTIQIRHPKTSDSSINQRSSVSGKICLFRSLFRGREDVFPKRWESKKTITPDIRFRFQQQHVGSPKIILDTNCLVLKGQWIVDGMLFEDFLKESKILSSQ